MMHRSLPRLLPLRRGFMTACTLAAAWAGFASSASAALDSVINDSPFIPPNWQPPQARPPMSQLPAVPYTLELHGYSQVGNNVMFSLYDVRNRTSFWVTQNDPMHPDIQIVGYNLSDPVNSTVEINDRGRDVELTMQPPSAQPMAVPPPTPPLVVYSPFDTGSANNRGGPAPGAGVPAPGGNNFAAGGPGGGGFLLRGQGNGGGGGGGRGYGRGGGGGGYGNGGGGNGAGGGGYGNGGGGGGFGNGGGGGAGVFGGGANTANNGYTNAGGGGFGAGGGGGAARRQIVQPGG